MSTMMEKTFRDKSYIAFFLLALSAFTLSGLSDSSFARSSSTASSTELILILDASGSMWGQAEGENKIAIAKKVLKELIGGLPEDTEVGLIAYGHRRKGDCNDIEAIVELGPIDKALLTEKIDALNPKGKTPITDSVLMAFEAVRASEDAGTVILVSDGIETCGGDPCKAIRDAKETGVNFVMHVVGFDLTNEDVSQLECVAQAGGGRYFSARNAAELSDALTSAVELPADLPTGKLSVKVTSEGKLKDALVTITDTKTGEDTGGGRTYTSPDTNPRRVPLPDGTYDVQVAPIGIKGAQDIALKRIEIREGETVEKVVDFSFGKLSVGVKVNGSLSDATVSLYEAGTNNHIASGRTYNSHNSNPRDFRLSPGRYDVVVKSLGIANKPSKKFSGVEITSGEIAEKSVEFSSGVLKLGAVLDGRLVDAVVSVREADTDPPVAQGRTYNSPDSNPKEFILLPGLYKVNIKLLKMERDPSKELEIEVKAEQTVENTVDFTK